MVGEHGSHTFDIVIVVLLFLLLSFDGFFSTSAPPPLPFLLDKWFVKTYLIVNWIFHQTLFKLVYKSVNVSRITTLQANKLSP